MRRAVRVLSCLHLAIGLMALGPSVFAHHSDRSRYDATDAIVLSGTVTGFSFVNPHATLRLEAENRVGNLAVFEIDVGSPALLLRYGITPETFNIGDQLTVTVWRQRANNYWNYWGRGFRTADGTALGEFPPE
jgi:hypothetical protein